MTTTTPLDDASMEKRQRVGMLCLTKKEAENRRNNVKRAPPSTYTSKRKTWGDLHPKRVPIGKHDFEGHATLGKNKRILSVPTTPVNALYRTL